MADSRSSLQHILARDPADEVDGLGGAKSRDDTTEGKPAVGLERAVEGHSGGGGNASADGMADAQLDAQAARHTTLQSTPHLTRHTTDDAAAQSTLATPQPPTLSTPQQHLPTTTDEPVHTSTTTSTRRNASGTVSSVYSGNKMRHLKKEDGVPLWRKDIQYDFLRLVFYDTTPVFTKFSDGTKGHTFAEVYIDAMAKSSKCSKILKEKLLQDREGAVCMAMVCLLVNVGRMNTTLNCESLPLSTWHAWMVVRRYM